MEILTVLAVCWIASGFLGVYVAAQKGRPWAEGAALGFLFGPVGCLTAAMLPAGAGPGPDDDDDDDEAVDPLREARARAFPGADPVADPVAPGGVIDMASRGLSARVKGPDKPDSIDVLGIKT